MCSPCGPCSPCDPCAAPFEPKQPTTCRSRELRCGIMYTTCDCIKRNGLQDKCPRSMCQGRPACMSFPVPSCCPSCTPLKFANMTMGVNKKRQRCETSSGGGSAGCATGGASAPRACGGYAPPCCGPHSAPCDPPAPIPCSPYPGCCCPPLPEGGMPDPRVWNCCNTPPAYPCCCGPCCSGCCPCPCPARYLCPRPGEDNAPCIWCCPCKAHCYNTPPKPCC